MSKELEVAAWSISYDGKTPYALWHNGDGPLLDLEIKRQGGSTCKLALISYADAQAEIAGLKTYAATIAAERDALAKELEAAKELASLKAQSEPVAWIRKWAFDGEEPKKEKRENGRMAWPAKFKVIPVSRPRLLKDDVALYTHPAPADKDAERYRWIRREHDIDSPVGRVCWKRNSDRTAGDWVNIIDGADLDAHIDAAIAKEGKNP